MYSLWKQKRFQEKKFQVEAILTSNETILVSNQTFWFHSSETFLAHLNFFIFGIKPKRFRRVVKSKGFKSFKLCTISVSSISNANVVVCHLSPSTLSPSIFLSNTEARNSVSQFFLENIHFINFSFVNIWRSKWCPITFRYTGLYENLAEQNYVISVVYYVLADDVITGICIWFSTHSRIGVV